MRHISKKKRFIIGVTAFLFFVILSHCLSDILGNLSMLLIILGSIIFVYLNPELMRGE